MLDEDLTNRSHQWGIQLMVSSEATLERPNHFQLVVS